MGELGIAVVEVKLGKAIEKEVTSVLALCSVLCLALLQKILSFLSQFSIVMEGSTNVI